MKLFERLISTIVLFALAIISARGETQSVASDNLQGKGRIKMACVGNSITYGMKLKDRERQSYPARLQEMLGEDYQVGNFGKNGATLLRKGHRPYIQQEEFAKALAFKPDILVVHLGVNDTDPRDFPDFGDDFVKDYTALIDTFKSINPNVRVIIANLSPILSKHPRFKSGTRAWRDSIRALIPVVAKATGSELADFGALLRDHPNMIPDGIHPDKDGAFLIARNVSEKILRYKDGLKMPGIYSDNMVLQRYRPLKIRGKALPEENVKVEIAGVKASALADADGNWIAVLPPLKESESETMLVTTSSDTLVFKNVAIGEVWLASGQSNMEFNEKLASSFAEDMKSASDSLLRFFNMVPMAITDAKEWEEEVKKRVDSLNYFKPTFWTVSDEKSLPQYSGVAWHFARQLRDKLGVPVGIVSNAVGGSPIESWIDIETLEHTLPEILTDWRSNDYLQPWVQKRITENIGDLNDSILHRHPYEPSYLFASGIRQINAYPVAGVIWYQGESNAHNIELNEILFPAFIQSWRQNWEDTDMPVLFVQLSSIERPSWPEFRNSQRKMAAEIPNTWMAVSSDKGDRSDVHPKDKKPVGERLARLALHHLYSMTNIVPEGPVVQKAFLSAPDRLCVSFTNSDGLTTSDGMPPASFEILLDDGMWHPANAMIDRINNTIIITDMNIRNAKSIRYGWQPYSEGNLVNGEELPASTFKIDIDNDNILQPEQGIESGISGAFNGSLNGEVVLAGGCNFPANPMAKESKKNFYSGIYKIGKGTETVFTGECIGFLDVPKAYGASVSLPDGILMIGGADNERSYADVKLLKNEHDGGIKIISYPSLPFTMDNMAAATDDGRVFVAGGNIDGKPGNSLLMLDLSKKEDGWIELPPFPGNPRVQPVMGYAKDKGGKESLYIWGGFAGKTSDREASLNTDGLKYDIRNKEWSLMHAPKDPSGEEISLGGGVMISLEDKGFLATGGVNKDIFLEALQNQAPDYLSHPVEWYRFNPYLLLFNPDTEEWKVIEKNPSLALAGASMVKNGMSVYVAGGEVKPRIRSAQIIEIEISEGNE